jgi:hypothetical protein
MERPVEPDLGDHPQMFDLRYLRKGPGLTRARLSKTPGLLALLGTDDPDAALRLLKEAIEQIGGNREARALVEAYGLGEGPGEDLQARRRRFAVCVERSADTVRDWEDAALRDLLWYLLSQRPVPEAPTPTYLLWDFRLTYHYRDRAFIGLDQYREVVALLDGPDAFRYGSNEPTVLSDVKGATWTVEDHRGDIVIHRLQFPQVLTKGERHQFSFRERRPPGVPSPEYEQHRDMASQLFHMPARQYELTIEFGGGVPEVIWRFEQMAPLERPGRPGAHNRVKVSDDGVVRESFRDLYGGFASGVAWIWDH